MSHPTTKIDVSEDTSQPGTTNGKPLCRFFVLHKGKCRYGSNCAYSHVIPEGMPFDDAKQFVPCPYFARGGCRYGDHCQLMHENPMKNSKQREATDHSDAATMTKAENQQQQRQVLPPPAVVTCGICLEDSPQQLQRYGLLSCCNHSFCFDCLMEWRKEGSSDASGRRSCPTCRKHSDYVIPSKFFPTSEEDKQAIVQEYKNRKALIPCHRFQRTMKLGSCPFGSDCFYAHIDISGRDVKAQDKSMKTIVAERERQRNDRRWAEASDDDHVDFLLGFLRLLDLHGYPGVRDHYLSDDGIFFDVDEYEDDDDDSRLDHVGDDEADYDDEGTHSSSVARHIRETLTIDFSELEGLDESDDNSSLDNAD